MGLMGQALLVFAMCRLRFRISGDVFGASTSPAARLGLERMRAAVAVSSLDALPCSLDSVFNVAFPAISVDSGVPPGRIALLIVFYHVPIGILTTLGGRLGDCFGHRRVFACWVSNWYCPGAATFKSVWTI
jgi:MFS family permease